MSRQAARATHAVSAGASSGESSGESTGKSALKGDDGHGVRDVHDVRDRLAVGLLNERDSVVYDVGCTGWSLYLENAGGPGLGQGHASPG